MSPEAQRAFAKAIGAIKYVDDIRRFGEALVAALDRGGQKRLLALIAVQADALARFGYIHKTAAKAQRERLFERVGQVERLATAARLAGTAHDRPLAALVARLPDGSVRATLIGVLAGGQVALPLGAPKALAALVDDRGTSDPIVLRTAVHAMFASGVTAASKRARAVLAAAPRAKTPRELALLGAVVDALESEARERELALTAWGPELFPLATHPERAIAAAARRLINDAPDRFLGYLAWAADDHDEAAVITVIAEQLYWAMLPGRQLTAAQVAAPLQVLLARATARKAKASVAALTRAMAKLKIVAAPPPKPRAPAIAQVGTEGGPVLVVPTKFVGAWLGVDGPEPFDTGNSDYERACDARRPALIAVGAGHGVAMSGQGVDVYAEPNGLLLVDEGDPAEEVAKAWRKVGALEVPAGGLVALDATEVGKRKGVNRAAVALAKGTYDVLAHRPKGLGGDLSAVRLVRRGAR